MKRKDGRYEGKGGIKYRKRKGQEKNRGRKRVSEAGMDRQRQLCNVTCRQP